MARTYAPIYVSIWRDEDFQNLSMEAQRLYFLINSQAEITHCGVVLFSPRRWSRWACNTTEDDINDALEELVKASYVIHDDRTEEIWVRSYLEYNKVWDQPKVKAAALRQYDEVHSKRIRAAIWDQMREGDQKPRCRPIEGVSDTPPIDQVVGIRYPQVIKNLEPEPEYKSSSQAIVDGVVEEENSVPPQHAFDDIAEATWRILGERKFTNRTTSVPVLDYEAWFVSVRAGCISQHGGKLEELLALEPRLTATQLADALEPQLRARSPSETSANQASQSPIQRVAQHITRPWCDDCEGTTKAKDQNGEFTNTACQTCSARLSKEHA